MTTNLKSQNTHEHMDKPFPNTDSELHLLNSKVRHGGFGVLLSTVKENESSISDDFVFYIDDK